MFESYFELIDNPINKEIHKLTRENKAKTKIIEDLLIKHNKEISQLKIQYRNLRLEYKNLIKEKDSFKQKYRNLKGNCKNKKKKNKSPVSKRIRKVVFERDNYKCLVCGTDKNLTLDHIIPRSKGGSNKINNLQVLCKYCNLAKGDTTINYSQNKIEPLIKRKKKPIIEFNFTNLGMFDIKI